MEELVRLELKVVEGGLKHAGIGLDRAQSLAREGGLEAALEPERGELVLAGVVRAHHQGQVTPGEGV